MRENQVADPLDCVAVRTYVRGVGDILQTLQRRYGELEIDLAWSRLLMRQNRTRARLEVIDEQLAELTQERRQLAGENRRLQSAKAALIDDMVERVRTRHNEGWSPTPVVGYRVWGIVDDLVLGATGHRWETPVMAAECAGARPDDDLPHTDHLCSTVGHGCGIYAAARPSLVAPQATNWILGIVLLSGKVVEHEHGFRAAHARVAGVVAHGGGRRLVTDDADMIERLFIEPGETLDEVGEVGHALEGTELIEAVEGLERSMDRWTSANNNG